MSQDDVAALVERLEKCHEYIEKNAADESVDPDDVRQWGTIYSEAASAIKAQAAEIVELQKKVWTLEADAEASLDIANQCRADAEAAEAKLREARADGMREATEVGNTLRAAINYALDCPDGLEWLREWNQGDREAMKELDSNRRSLSTLKED